ncbi:nucleotidyltransferase family protein [Photobacterium sp. BZF1]|uniref:nucleotidyltransferase domain-containing protein n=1 Tax=Photobacterium sp. BZF1 TaxID=1904457 RepID=UPI001653C872|nr:nucleotidyltransferase family protein [Photobacterium sp. BZF1]MBC7004722.1 nucleotidyltransferase family protein [Photobacterium sp. BZF1]
MKLVDVLASPIVLDKLTLSELSSILSEARYHNMVSQLYYLSKSYNIYNSLPEKFQQHLYSSFLIYDNQRKKFQSEVNSIEETLTPLGIELIYLKGGAYHLQDITMLKGRLMSDLDILVREDALIKAEQQLKRNGWVSVEVSDYDDNFYRNWSHEIPPLKNFLSQVELDLHFNILPKTIKESPGSNILFKQSVPIEKNPMIRTLTPAAMIVHSSIHLFHESEFYKGTRDLYDLVLLIQSFEHEEDFWGAIIRLQQEIGNGVSVYYALRYCNKIYKLETPDYVKDFYDNFKPDPLTLLILDYCFTQVFTNHYPIHRGFFHKVCELILYSRGHLKRMPLKLLVPHFIKKTTLFFKGKQESKGMI